MKNIKLFLVWMLIAVLAVSPVHAESSGSAEEDALAYLGRELDAAAKRLIRLDDLGKQEVFNIAEELLCHELIDLADLIEVKHFDTVALQFGSDRFPDAL